MEFAERRRSRKSQSFKLINDQGKSRRESRRHASALKYNTGDVVRKQTLPSEDNRAARKRLRQSSGMHL